MKNEFETIHEFLVKDYLLCAEFSFSGYVLYAYRKEMWNFVLRQSHEVVEYSLKALIHFIGKTPPHKHLLGNTLEKYKEELPEPVRPYVPFLKAVSNELGDNRTLSSYGSETMVPTEAFSQEDADAAMESADCVLKIVKGTIKGNLSGIVLLPENDLADVLRKRAENLPD